MRKEVVLAISIGFILGLIITYGFWLADNSLNKLPTNTNTTQTEEPTPTQSPLSPTPPTTTQTPANGTNSKLSINISEPTDEHLSDKSAITIKGTTSPNTVVAVTDEQTETTVTSDSSGNFSLEVKLEGGYNTITATAVDKQGNTATTSIIVTYTTAKI